MKEGYPLRNGDREIKEMTNGKTVWKRARTTYVRVWTPETTTTSRSETCPWDPVAESIWIEEDSGIYVDSIDIFFAAKDFF